jgi:hypothetical protein
MHGIVGMKGYVALSPTSFARDENSLAPKILYEALLTSTSMWLCQDSNLIRVQRDPVPRIGHFPGRFGVNSVGVIEQRRRADSHNLPGR